VFVANTLHPTAVDLLHPDRPGGEALAGAVGTVAKANLIAQLALLEVEAALLPTWLQPQNPSILSLYLLVILRWITTFAADAALNVRLDAFPHLQALVLAQELRPAIARVAEAEGLGPTPFSAARA